LKTIQEALKMLGLKGELEMRPLATHQNDVSTAAITAVFHLKNQI